MPHACQPAAKAQQSASVIIEIINTGAELMLGRVLNTHQQWLCGQLADAGYEVTRQVGIDDTADRIQAAVREALDHADLVITTGGLGPTSDDLTRDAVARLLGRSLHEDADVRAHIDQWFAHRKRPQPPATRIQAQVPDGALVLPNAHGTAPGLLIDCGPRPGGTGASRWLVMLPGPPRELRPMFATQVLPWLKRTFPLTEPFVCRTLRSTGIGESAVQERIAPALAPLVAEGLTIGYCARPGEVDVRLVARHPEAERIVTQAEAIVRAALDRQLFGIETEPLEAIVVQLLIERGATLVVAESCTGGRLANRLTDVAGASAVFVGGAITYSNAMKQQLLGVRAETLAAHGAVSEAVAREMAEGARQRLGADFALATTGIAGPSGGSEAKPVGTVFIGLATPARTLVLAQQNRFDRDTFKQITTQQALEVLRRELLAPPPTDR